jgi:hypothetical protein
MVSTVIPESFYREVRSFLPFKSWIPPQKRRGNDGSWSFAAASISRDFAWLNNSAYWIP